MYMHLCNYTLSRNVGQETERQNIDLRMEGRTMDLRYFEERDVHSSLKVEREEGKFSPTPETED